MKNTHKSFGCMIVVILALSAGLSQAAEQPLSVFPLANYPQQVDAWIKPSEAQYDQPVLSAEMQKQRMDIFYDHTFGVLSPWSATYVNDLLQDPNEDLGSLEKQLLDNFSNEGKAAKWIGYGENFRPYTAAWIKAIADNVNASALSHLAYQADHRAIAVANLEARVLPTNDVHFFHYTTAGQGYPFDNLQMSSIWAGTPLYVIADSQDHAWKLVISPALIGWVPANKVAYADEVFVSQWQAAAKMKLMAVTKTKTSMVTNNGRFVFSAYIGSIFPAANDAAVMVPVANQDQHAVIETVSVQPDHMAAMPLSATPHHFADIMKSLIGRPYGWGGMYFYNDCSQELKALYAPFGIWLPRHSSAQVTEGKMVDQSSLPIEQRLQYLQQNGKPFMTIVYVGGHVVLYLGNFDNPQQPGQTMAMTYQDMWGLRSKTKDFRYVVGESVLFPLLTNYPEQSDAASQAGKRDFQVANFDQLPADDSALLAGHPKASLRELLGIVK